MTELHFRDFPRSARTLIVGMCAVGVAALIGGVYAPPPRGYEACFVYLALAFLASSQRLRMHPRFGTMSLGFLFVFAALFQCGTVVAISCAVLGAVGGLLFAAASGRRQSVPATLYAAGSLATAALAAGTVLDVAAPPDLRPLKALLLPAGAAVGVYYVISVASIGLISVLAGGGSSRKWLTESLWMGPVYFVGGAAALAIDAAYQHFGLGVFVLGLPVIYVVQRSYAIRAEQTEEKLRHLEERTRASERMASLYMSIVQALSTAIDAKDHGTRLHVRRVRKLAVAVGRRVGLREAELQAVETGAVLHDIGKLAVPDHILRKPSRLTEDEYRMVRDHPAVGEAILKPIDFGVDVASIVRHHHEKMDGSGYPDGLSGDHIPLAARVLGVIDVYDALVSDRPYRTAWRSERAITYLHDRVGTSFDPNVVDALVDVLESGEWTEEDAEPEIRLPAHASGHGPYGGPASSTIATSRAATVDQEWYNVLSDVVTELATSEVIHTCVAYRIDDRYSEISVVAAAGEQTNRFRRLRVPIGVGPSGLAAETGCLVVNQDAADDFACAALGAPTELAASVVSAVPVIGPTGRLLAVLSLYGHQAVAVSDCVLPGASVAAAEAGRRMESAADSRIFADARRDGLLEYAAFLAMLNREVDRADAADSRIVVMAINMRRSGRGSVGKRLLDLARELRLCGRGLALVLDREETGEIVAMFPAVVEASALDCVRKFDEELRDASVSGSAAEPVTLTVGSAVFPDDATSVHGLISVAEMRMERSRHERSGAQAALEITMPV